MVAESYETIAGTSAIDCDPIASRLAERLESLSLDGPLSEALKNGEFNSGTADPQCELEIEVRLGILQNQRSDQRYYLPLRTDTLLSRRAKTKFISSVTELQYKAAKSIVSLASEQSNVKDSVWESKLNVCTANLSFDTPEYEEPVRITVFQDSKGSRDANLRAIRKVKLLKWDVTAGTSERDEDDIDGHVDLDTNILDYRIAINLEYKVPIKKLPTINEGLTRKIQRDSFLNTSANIKFDFSHVEDNTDNRKSNTPPTPSYEIEIELVGSTIVKILSNKNLEPKDRLQALKYHCAGLIRTVKYLRDYITTKNRDLVESTNLNAFGHKLKISDLRVAAQDDESADRYKKFVSPQMPIIGDYLFRTLAVDVEKYKDKIDKKTSLYTKHFSDIPGPFIVETDNLGNRHVTLSKR